MFLWIVTVTPSFSADLWVDTLNGDDQQDGQSATTALRTLNAATALAKPGTTVHIQPGIYRESIHFPKLNSSNSSPITYLAESGQGSVIIRGSESAENLMWTALTENTIGLPSTANLNRIFWTDLSTWNLTTAPRFIVQLDDKGEVVKRFTLAREPEESVANEAKYHEYWWMAEGGSTVASCNPAKDIPRASCDEAERSLTQLTDRQDDTQPEGIAPGNLTTLGNLSGATLVAMDTVHGYFAYRRTIATHEVSLGRVTVDQPASFKTPERAGLGWGSKYYLENHPALLDQSGEYWFDAKTQRLYLWQPESVEFKHLEISRQATGCDLSQRSYLILEGLTFEFFNDTIIDNRNSEQQRSYDNQLRDLTLRYANRGLVVEQTLSSSSSADTMVTGLLLENSTISNMDSLALHLKSAWANDSAPASFTHPPITHTILRHNHIHHIGFAADQDRQAAVLFNFPDHLQFENNQLHHTAYDGVQVNGTVIQSDKGYDFANKDIKTGNIVLHHNVIENTCQLVEECGGLKIVGVPPQNHVFRELLISSNTFRANKGWSFVAEQRHLWANGYFGFGIHLSDVSGIHIYRNLAYNHTWSNVFLTQHWRDGEIVISNNVLANAPRGIDIWNSKDIVTHQSVGTQITNNIIVNHENFGIVHTINLDEASVVINNNLYYSNGWGTMANLGVMKAANSDSGGHYSTLAEVRAATPWEKQGLEGDPTFKQYDYSAQALAQESQTSVDFHLNRYSPAIDKGTPLALSLQTLLKDTQFKEIMPLQGTAWDMGAFEFSEKDFSIQGTAIDMTTLKPVTTEAYFNSFVTSLLSGSGNNITVAAIDTLKIAVDVFPAAADVAQPADLMMVASYTPANTPVTQYFMRQGSAWLSWDGHVEHLTTAEVLSALPEQWQVVVYEGELTTMPGEFVVYVGYLTKGLLNFNGQQPLKFTIK